MCGIIVTLDNSKDIDVPEFIKMRDRMYHRGPDYGGIWIDETKKVALGHRRLSIIDHSSNANQPMISRDGKYVLVFNGEIYNFKTLRRKLKSLGCRFVTESDTEVLLEALIYWGEDAIPKLNGMFAFAFWDNAAKKLLVARDRFGEKPLFFSNKTKGILILASEMKAILPHSSVSNKINDSILDLYVNGFYTESEDSTFFSDISRFPASNAAIFNEFGDIEKQWRYWSPDYNAINYDLSIEEASSTFLQLFENSVKTRLQADVNIGSSLSGGLDSSSIVGQISKLLIEDDNKNTQKAFSARFDNDLTISEGDFIDEVLKKHLINGHSIQPEPEKLLSEIEILHWHQEEPFLSASIFLQWSVAKLAAQNQTSVLLDGQGADELLAGYQFYFKTHQLDLIDQKSFGKLLYETLQFNSRLNAASKKYADSGRRINNKVAYNFGQLFGQMLRQKNTFNNYNLIGVPKVEKGKRIRNVLAMAMQYNSLPQLLRYADRNSMAFSIETRLPFLDYDLVDFCISLPDNMFFKDGWQKYLLRKSTKGFVPNNIRWRADKVGYAAPLDVWLRGDLKTWAKKRLFESPITAVNGYNQKKLEALWVNHQEDKANNSWEIWKWLSLSEWLRLNTRNAFSEGLSNQGKVYG